MPVWTSEASPILGLKKEVGILVCWPVACINILFDVLKWGRLAISDGDGRKIEGTKGDGSLSRAEMENQNMGDEMLEMRRSMARIPTAEFRPH